MRFPLYLGSKNYRENVPEAETNQKNHKKKKKKKKKKKNHKKKPRGKLLMQKPHGMGPLASRRLEWLQASVGVMKVSWPPEALT